MLHVNDPDDEMADTEEAGFALLARHGFERYEISAFAQPGRRCRHNLNYWQFGDYLGIGAGAHGKLSSHEGIVRQMRHKHPGAYLAAHSSGQFIQEQHSVGADDLPFEFMMNAMRLIDGVPADLFEARTGLPMSAIEPALIRARDKGLMSAGFELWRPTLQGQRFLNDLLQLFL